jgi:hypothetical protein
VCFTRTVSCVCDLTSWRRLFKPGQCSRPLTCPMKKSFSETPTRYGHPILTLEIDVVECVVCVCGVSAKLNSFCISHHPSALALLPFWLLCEYRSVTPEWHCAWTWSDGHPSSSHHIDTAPVYPLHSSPCSLSLSTHTHSLSLSLAPSLSRSLSHSPPFHFVSLNSWGHHPNPHHAVD